MDDRMIASLDAEDNRKGGATKRRPLRQVLPGMSSGLPGMKTREPPRAGPAPYWGQRTAGRTRPLRLSKTTGHGLTLLIPHPFSR
jgi:hypothetical protein